jgi:hypothetical protein
VDDLAALCGAAGVPVEPIGEVTEGGQGAELEVVGQFTLELSRIKSTWQAPIPAAMLNDPLLAVG